MKNSQKGFAALIIIIILALAAGGTGYYVINKSKVKQNNDKKNTEVATSTISVKTDTDVPKTEPAKSAVKTEVKAVVNVPKPVVSVKSSTTNPFQVVINAYSTCSKNDITCQCKYLTSYHCSAIKSGNTSFAHIQLLVGASVIKENISSQPFQQPGVNGGAETVLSAQLVKAPESFTLNGVTTQCLNATFIKESGAWKIGNPEPASCSI